jgi:hypothetical protein
MNPTSRCRRSRAQARYAAGTREILECWFDDRPIREEYLIVDRGTLAGAGAHSYSAGDATRRSDETARFKARSAQAARRATVEQLAQSKCNACRTDTSTVTDAEIDVLHFLTVSYRNRWDSIQRPSA